MATLSFPTPAEEQARGQESGVSSQESAVRNRRLTPDRLALDASLLIASFGEPAAVDYAAYACRLGQRKVAVIGDGLQRRVEAPFRAYALEEFTQAALQDPDERGPTVALILFVKRRLTERDHQALDHLLGLAAQQQTKFIGVVSTFTVHLGDQRAADAEAYVLTRAKGLHVRTVVFRPGHVLSNNSRAMAQLRRLGFSYPLVPRHLRNCCVEGDELFAAIERERRRSNGGLRSPRLRTYTLLGPNRPWRDWLARHRATGFWPDCLTVVSFVLSMLLFGHLVGLVLALIARRWPALRHWNFDTLRPRSFRELLALYNPYNYRHLKVVGYNNGVVHFGQRYPRKTIVSTVSCNRVARAGWNVVKADCGATVRQALDILARQAQELPVVPNYSYVCLGTSFFIPIHGSASDFSTVADTITRVVLYDPVHDRLIVASRDEPAFQKHVYNLQGDVLLLRLYLRVKQKARYYVHRQSLKDPGSGELLNALQDGRATNVEIRKASASSDTVTVCTYYTDPGATSSALLELPRDALGRLWDRLEENPLTSFLMHALTRHFAWHVELFFPAEQFAVFWKDHRALPLRKLQMRYIRRDGLRHSAFRDHDCVSVDLFMFRRHRYRFEAYLKKTFPVVRTNPGKHSK